MTIQQLKESIDRMLQIMPRAKEHELRILIDGSGIGGRPSVAVDRVEIGIDWDNGVLFLVPESQLTTKGGEAK
jgi:hypothetical protein